MKKIIAGLLATIAVFGAVPNGSFIVPEKSAFTASALDLDVIGKGSEGNFSCEYLSDGSIIIDGYFGTETEITIPDEINGHAIKYLNIIVYSDKEIFWAGVTKINASSNITFLQGRDVITDEKATELFSQMDISLNGASIIEKIEVISRGKCGENASYELTSDGVLTISGTGKIKDFEPDDVEFPKARLKHEIKNVVIEDGITTIGNSAFQNCSNLIKITIPESVFSIEANAFYNCINLTSITIPENITSIESNTFGGCYNLTEITIPESITNIGRAAFHNCSNLTKITIPEGVTTIEEVTFENCGLTSIIIPESVVNIESCAFKDCINLNSITIPQTIISLSNDAFDNTLFLANQPDGVIYIGDIAYKYKGDMPESTKINLKDGTSRINQYAFSGCKNLTGINIPDSVTSIGNCAFLDCTNLTEISIPDSVTSIGKSAFVRCTNLTEISIPDSVKYIGKGAFWDCENLLKITIPNSIDEIEETAFDFTSFFDKYYDSHPDGVIYISNVAYAHKGDIVEDSIIAIKEGTRSINYIAGIDEKFTLNIPSSVYKINYFSEGNDGGSLCSPAVRFEVDVHNENYMSNNGALYKKNEDGYELLYYPIDNSELTEIQLPEGVVSVRDIPLIGGGYISIFSDPDLKSIILPKSMNIYPTYKNYNGTITGSPISQEKITILNPKCEIPDSENSVYSEAAIYGYENSTAQAYAKKYNRKFVSLGDAPIEDLPLGDINGDSTVDASDASNVLAVYALVSTGKDSELTAEQIAAADVNKDGSIDASDASLILAYYAYIQTGGTGTLEEYLNS